MLDGEPSRRYNKCAHPSSCVALVGDAKNSCPRVFSYTVHTECIYSLGPSWDQETACHNGAVCYYSCLSSSSIVEVRTSDTRLSTGAFSTEDIISAETKCPTLGVSPVADGRGVRRGALSLKPRRRSACSVFFFLARSCLRIGMYCIYFVYYPYIWCIMREWRWGDGGGLQGIIRFRLCIITLETRQFVEETAESLME